VDFAELACKRRDLPEIFLSPSPPVAPSGLPPRWVMMPNDLVALHRGPQLVEQVHRFIREIRPHDPDWKLPCPFEDSGDQIRNVRRLFPANQLDIAQPRTFADR
jgi:hypothetical protein